MATSCKSGLPCLSRRPTDLSMAETRDDMTVIERSDTAGGAHDTEYVKMLKDEAEMETRYNIRVSAANWALLAGYLVVPGTFTSLQKSSQVEQALSNNKAGQVVIHTIQNPPLLAIACLFVLGAITTMCFLIRIHKIRSCYTWLINKWFMPAILNAAAGLLTSLINVYTSRGGHWSVMSIITTVITGLTFCVFSVLLVIYKFFKLRRVQQNDKNGLSEPAVSETPPKKDHSGHSISKSSVIHN